MTRSQRRQAHRRAAQYAQHILGILAAHPDAVRAVPLSHYPDAAAFHAILGDAGWSYEEWAECNRATMELLREAGCIILFAPMNPPEYFAWLAATGGVNDSPTRAQYASLKAPPPPPEPRQP